MNMPLPFSHLNRSRLAAPFYSIYHIYYVPILAVISFGAKQVWMTVKRYTAILKAPSKGLYTMHITYLGAHTF
jgi:hypothetical protein